MRAAACLLGLLALGLASCNANPLLQAAASNYTPFKVGSHWEYTSPDGSTVLDRTVTAEGTVNGRDAFTVTQSVNGTAMPDTYLAWDGGALLQWSSSLGWLLYRRLPLVNGDQWDTPTGNPLLKQSTIVDGIETVKNAPLGTFTACFRIRTRVETLDASGNVLSYTDSLAWSAPGIGDVRYANLNPNGSETITLDLTSWSIP